MAKVKHIQCETLPATLDANAIYFVRSTGEIVQTDSDGVGINYFGTLSPTYPSATTPLSDTDKLVVQQGGVWKEVNKSDLIKERKIVGGRWRVKLYRNGRYTVTNYSYGQNYALFENGVNTNFQNIISHPYTRMYYFDAGWRLVGVEIDARLSLKDDDFQLIVGRKRFEDNKPVNTYSTDYDLLANVNVIVTGGNMFSKYFDIPNAPLTKDNDVITIQFISNINDSVSNYLYSCGVNLIFEKQN